MQTATMQDVIIIAKNTTLLTGIIGSLFMVVIGLIVFIYLSYRKQNDREHSKLFDKTDDHAERISTIEGATKK